MCLGGQEGQQHLGWYQKQCSQQDIGGDFSLVLSSGEATHRVLSFSLQEKCSGSGAYTEKGNDAGKRSGKQIL